MNKSILEKGSQACRWVNFSFCKHAKPFKIFPQRFQVIFHHGFIYASIIWEQALGHTQFHAILAKSFQRIAKCTLILYQISSHIYHLCIIFWSYKCNLLTNENGALEIAIKRDRPGFKSSSHNSSKLLDLSIIQQRSYSIFIGSTVNSDSSGSNNSARDRGDSDTVETSKRKSADIIIRRIQYTLLSRPSRELAALLRQISHGHPCGENFACKICRCAPLRSAHAAHAPRDGPAYYKFIILYNANEIGLER